jgi:hypothetical protein
MHTEVTDRELREGFTGWGNRTLRLESGCGAGFSGSFLFCNPEHRRGNEVARDPYRFSSMEEDRAEGNQRQLSDGVGGKTHQTRIRSLTGFLL